MMTGELIEKTIKTFNYHHPIFDNAAVKAQKEFPKINGSNRTFYVGAYWGNGFHEDGVQSAINAHTVFKDEKKWIAVSLKAK